MSDRELAKTVLEPFEARIRSIIDRAWQDWLSTPDRGRFMFLARMRANMVFDAIARYAIEEFDGDVDVHVIVTKHTVKFVFKDQVLARFKKGNANGVGSNIETQAVLNFIDPQRNIPDLLPDLIYVEVCYKPDDLGASLAEVAVVGRDRTKRLWDYPLPAPEPGADIIPLPPMEPEETPPVVTPRRRKHDSEDAE